MKYVKFICHEMKITVRPKLAGGVTVIHHAPEGWQQIARMWRRSVTDWQGAQGLELQIPFIFDQWRYNPATRKSRESIEKELSQLEQLAEYQENLRRTPIFTIDGNGIVPHDVQQDHTKRWVVGELDLDDQYLINFQGNRCRQAGQINCIEWIPEQLVQSNNLIPTKPVPATYRIKKKDTLVKIAVYFYGDGSKWRDIAKLNHINDPNHLRVGRIIKLPKT